MKFLFQYVFKTPSIVIYMVLASQQGKNIVIHERKGGLIAIFSNWKLKWNNYRDLHFNLYAN